MRRVLNRGVCCIRRRGLYEGDLQSGCVLYEEEKAVYMKGMLNRGVCSMRKRRG